MEIPSAGADPDTSAHKNRTARSTDDPGGRARRAFFLNDCFSAISAFDKLSAAVRAESRPTTSVGCAAVGALPVENYGILRVKGPIDHAAD
jgi:hypothetical protein